MKFHTILEKNLKRVLKKIRIKVDPLHASSENFREIDCYEGYVLEEDIDMTKLIVIKAGMPIVDIPTAALQPQMQLMEGKMLRFKMFVLEFLKLTEENPNFQNIFTASTWNDLDQFIRQAGVSGDVLANLYREFIVSQENITEAAPINLAPQVTASTPPNAGSMWNSLKTAAGVAGNAIKSAITNPSGAAANINAIRQGGVSQAVQKGVQFLDKAQQEQIIKTYEKYYTKLDIPNGWPKKGSKMLFQHQSGNYAGNVDAEEVAGKTHIYTVNAFPEGSLGGMKQRIYVVTVNQGDARPYYSVKSVYASDVQPGGVIAKNEQISKNTYNLIYDQQKQQFLIGYAPQHMVYVYVASQPGLKVGDPINSQSITSEPVSGVVTSIINSPSPTAGGSPIQLYVVKTNPVII